VERRRRATGTRLGEGVVGIGLGEGVAGTGLGEGVVGIGLSEGIVGIGFGERGATTSSTPSRAFGWLLAGSLTVGGPMGRGPGVRGAAGFAPASTTAPQRAQRILTTLAATLSSGMVYAVSQIRQVAFMRMSLARVAFVDW